MVIQIIHAVNSLMGMTILAVLANLDESFLAKRCGLGYRAGYIIELARAILEGKIQLGQLQELSKDASLSNYKQLHDKLKQIRGYVPFTRANVLMCLGYYHVIPTDSETVRHLKQMLTTCFSSFIMSMVIPKLLDS